MYRTEKETRRFSTKSERDMTDYDAILNNPLCTILDEDTLKESTREFQEEGQMIQTDEIIKLVTWEEKKLL